MKYKIAVSGGASIENVPTEAIIKAKEIGKEIARHDCVLITGATTGMPLVAAQGTKEAQGLSIGFSPAYSEISHIKSYKLPTDFFDVIVYTGFGYSGRNLLMTRAADGVIVISGRMGTLNEFTIAFEDHKPIGVLEGSGGTADKIRSLIKGPLRQKPKIIFSHDPKELVEGLIKLMKKEKAKNYKAPRG